MTKTHITEIDKKSHAMITLSQGSLKPMNIKNTPEVFQKAIASQQSTLHPSVQAQPQPV